MSIGWWIKKSWYIHTIEHDSIIMKKTLWYMLQGWWYWKPLCQMKEETRPNTLYDPLYKNCPLKQATEKESRLAVGWEYGWEKGWLETGTKFLFAMILLLKIEFWQWLPNFVSLLNFIGLLHVWILCYINYISIKLLKQFCFSMSEM